MSDQVLDILKLVLLALLYLFFVRVLWTVWSEVRQPDARSSVDVQPPMAAAPTPADGRRAVAPPKPGRGKKGVPARLVVLEPKERRGTAFPITAGAPVDIGRDEGSTILVVLNGLRLLRPLDSE